VKSYALQRNDRVQDIQEPKMDSVTLSIKRKSQYKKGTVKSVENLRLYFYKEVAQMDLEQHSIPQEQNGRVEHRIFLYKKESLGGKEKDRRQMSHNLRTAGT
jgi:hypothetical protein